METPKARSTQMAWLQRMTLIRHNMHQSLRTNDFIFFKTLQAQTVLHGSDPVAVLQSSHKDADSILNALADLFTCLVYAHQDSFKTIYDSNKVARVSSDDRSRVTLLRVDACQQRQIVDIAIDKITNSGIAIVEQQPDSVKDTIANIWVLGATVAADALQACSLAMVNLEDFEELSDFIFLEYAWQDVQAAVEQSVATLRGILHLLPISSTVEHGQQAMEYTHRYNPSVTSATSWIRRLSTVLTNGVNGASDGSSGLNSPVRKPSIPIASPAKTHDSFSPYGLTAAPTVRRRAALPPQNLPTIAPTPAVASGHRDSEVNPFEVGFERYLISR